MTAIAVQGDWDASTNTPTLSDASGTDGYVYAVTAAGTVDFGSGDVEFWAGDKVVFNGDVWERIPGESVSDTQANYSSLAAFAAKTDEDWTTEITDEQTAIWGEDGVLGYLFTGLEMGKPFVVAVIEAIIHQVFDTVTDAFDNIDDAFDSMASNFSGKWRDIIAAQNAADYANAQLAVMNRLISDLFDLSAGTLSADWDVSYTGALASGQIKEDGHGNAWWDGFGGLTRTGYAIWVSDTTATDVQIVSTVMPSPVQQKLLGGESYLRLLGRCDGTTDNFVYAEIGYDYCAVGYRTSGTDYELDNVAVATANGDNWDFLVGTADSDDQFVLYRNGVAVVDTSSASPNKGASYRSVGFVMHAADRLVFLSQTSPGTMAMFSADDQ